MGLTSNSPLTHHLVRNSHIFYSKTYNEDFKLSLQMLLALLLCYINPNQWGGIKFVYFVILQWATFINIKIFINHQLNFFILQPSFCIDAPDECTFFGSTFIQRFMHIFLLQNLRGSLFHLIFTKFCISSSLVFVLYLHTIVISTSIIFIQYTQKMHVPCLYTKWFHL